MLTVFVVNRFRALENLWCLSKILWWVGTVFENMLINFKLFPTHRIAYLQKPKKIRKLHLLFSSLDIVFKFLYLCCDNYNYYIIHLISIHSERHTYLCVFKNYTLLKDPSKILAVDSILSDQLHFRDKNRGICLRNFITDKFITFYLNFHKINYGK